MTLEIGHQLQQERYRIRALLSRGGMGTVYLATDRNLSDRQVALKENVDTNPATQEQFQYEALLLSRLTHPNLPRVSDHFIEPSGRQYLVMDYVEGDDLRTLLHAHNGPLPEELVLQWLDQVLNALTYMHNWIDPTTRKPTPIIHRDIKPGNIKRTPNGRIVLVDFGVAKIDETTEGTVVGAKAITHGYSPLEQYTGGTDARSDIYALGATLYMLLTGQRPPHATARATGTPLVPPRQLNRQLNRTTESVILRALALRPADRFQTVDELRAALPRLRENGANDQRGPHVGSDGYPFPVGKPHEHTRRNRWTYVSTVTALIALALLITAIVTIPNTWLATWTPLAEQDGPLTAAGILPGGGDGQETANNAAGIGLSTAITTTPTVIATTTTITATTAATDVPSPAATVAVATAASSVISTTTVTSTGTVPPTITSTATERPTAPPTPVPTLSSTAPATATAPPTATPIPMPTATPIPTATPTATARPIATASATQVFTATPTPVPTLSPTTHATATARPTATPRPTPTATMLPTATPTPVPLPSPTVLPSSTPTPTPTQIPPPPVAGDVHINETDGALYRFVPAGPFAMGSIVNPDETPVHVVDLDAFWIMETEVTNAYYRHCVEAGACTPPRNERWQDGAFTDHPVTNVDWTQAIAYANWVRGRLPTEAEWEKAARGTDERMFPWADETMDSEHLNFSTQTTTAVGSFAAGASPYGLLDMAGNVEEWVLDWHSPTYYAESPAANPTGPDTGIFRVVRGGSFTSNRGNVRTTARGRAFPDSPFAGVGFRVVLPAPTVN